MWMYDKGRYREQLFDMNADRGEMRNLAVEKKYEAELNLHRALLNDWMKQHKTKADTCRFESWFGF